MAGEGPQPFCIILGPDLPELDTPPIPVPSVADFLRRRLNCAIRVSPVNCPPKAKRTGVLTV